MTPATGPGDTRHQAGLVAKPNDFILRLRAKATTEYRNSFEGKGATPRANMRARGVRAKTLNPCVYA